MEELEARPRSMITLLDLINEGSIVVPEFQRDFVWRPSNTISLLLSIIKDYPAGNLLLWKYRPENSLANRVLEGVKAKQKAPQYLILDGQQRLTTLYQAFFGKGENRYFIDLDKLSDENIDDCIRVFSEAKLKKDGLNDVGKQFELKMLPLEAIFYQHNDYGNDWKMCYIKNLKNKKEDPFEFIDWFNKIEKAYLNVIEKYKFAVTELPANMEMEAVCQIFESLNSTGIRLGAFELSTARLYPHNINLREMWDLTKSEHGLIREFDIDPIELLKAISLIRTNLKPTCKRGDILKLSNVDFVADWNTCVKHLDEALSVLKDECGVLGEKWLPYNSILAPMIALFIEVDKFKGARKSEAKNKIIRWFWCSIFSKNYDASTDTRAMKDYFEMLKWFNGNNEPDAVKNFSIQFVDLRNTTKPSDAVYKGIICLIVKNGAKDFHDGKKITTQMMINNDIDDHHVFPQSYLKSKAKKEKYRQMNSVLNKTLINANTNKRISRKSPADYLKEIERTVGKDKLMDILKSHLLVTASDTTLRNNSFPKFLKEREKILKSAIVKVTRPA